MGEKIFSYSKPDGSFVNLEYYEEGDFYMLTVADDTSSPATGMVFQTSNSDDKAALRHLSVLLRILIREEGDGSGTNS